MLAILSAFSTGQVQACGYVRLVQPLTHPAIASDISFHAVDIETALHAQADALIIQRTAVTSLDQATRLIEHCRKSAIRLVYEIDDDLFRLPAEHPEHAHYAIITKAARLIARAADAVTVPPEALRQMLLRYNENVILIPNYVDERLWLASDPSAQPHSNRLRALYMGTSSHLPDLALLEEPIRLLNQKIQFRTRCRRRFLRYRPFSLVPLHQRPHHLGMSYPNFVRWLTSGGPWDFGLAPLLESRFNTHKSAIKVYEYAALGLPTVASAVAPYLGVIEDSKPDFWCLTQLASGLNRSHCCANQPASAIDSPGDPSAPPAMDAGSQLDASSRILGSRLVRCPRRGCGLSPGHEIFS